MNLRQIKTTIGSQLAKSGYNNSEFARLCGIDKKTVRRMLYTESSVAIPVLLKMCDTLGLELVIRRKNET